MTGNPETSTAHALCPTCGAGLVLAIPAVLIVDSAAKPSAGPMSDEDFKIRVRFMVNRSIYSDGKSVCLICESTHRDRKALGAHIKSKHKPEILAR